MAQQTTIDPDMETARLIAAATDRHGTDTYRQFMREGAYDEDSVVQSALIGIKVGRGLDPLSIKEAARLTGGEVA